MATRRTQEEQRAIYEAWHQSGLTRTVFCRQNHIRVCQKITFLYQSNALLFASG